MVEIAQEHDPIIRDALIRAAGVQAAFCGLGRQAHDYQCCGAFSYDVYSDFVRLGKYRVRSLPLQAVDTDTSVRYVHAKSCALFHLVLI